MNTPVVNVCIESRVIQLLSGYFPAMHYKINSHSRLVEDLNVDSVDVVEIVMMIDEAFNLEVPSTQVAQWRSVADIVHSVAEASE